MTFARGSRYRDQPKLAALTAQGEVAVGTELRSLPAAGGIFQHRVRGGDRLDLLASRYYGDASRWWQIADANPEFSYPLDLVDQRPIVDEELGLEHAGYGNAVTALVNDLAALGPAELGPVTLMSAVVTIEYALAATRTAALARVASGGFALLGTFAWPAGAATREALRCESRAVKRSWQSLVSTLVRLPGMLRVVPRGFEGLTLRYNEAVLARAGVLAEIARAGFSVTTDPARAERAGAALVIPPNRTA